MMKKRHIASTTMICASIVSYILLIFSPLAYAEQKILTIPDNILTYMSVFLSPNRGGEGEVKLSAHHPVLSAEAHMLQKRMIAAVNIVAIGLLGKELAKEDGGDKQLIHEVRKMQAGGRLHEVGRQFYRLYVTLNMFQMTDIEVFLQEAADDGALIRFVKNQTYLLFDLAR